MANPYAYQRDQHNHFLRASPRAADSFFFQASRSKLAPVSQFPILEKFFGTHKVTPSSSPFNESRRMTILPSGPSDLSTPASSSRFLNASWEVHYKANSSSTTDINLLELDHNNGPEKGYSSDSGFFSKVFRKARLLSNSKSKKIPQAMPSGSPADIPVLTITVDTPESTRDTIAQESEMVQLAQPEGGIPPPQPPIPDPTGSHNTARPSPLGTSALRRDIFRADAPKPMVRSPTPIHPQARMESTLQLVFCASLLLEDHHLSTSQSSPTEVCVLDDAGRRWFDAIQEDLPAQTRIRWLVSRLVAEFLKDPSPGPEAIFEVVILGPVLCQADYRALLSCFIMRFDNSALLNINLLQGMIQLLQSAPSGFLADDDLVHIVSSIRKRLESTHAPDRVHVYQLVFAVSKILEVMVRGEVKGLNRQRDHQSLLASLRNLKGVDDDEFLKFQVNYAYQMSLYLPDDETSFQAFWRYAESVAVGVSAVASVFKLDPMSALAAVEHIQQVAGNAIDVVKFNIDGTRAFQSTAEGATQATEKAYWSQKKQLWFLALQAGYLFVQDGRLADLNILVCDAARRFDVNFQCGICQLLGEVALNPLWDDGSRESAIDFLGELCKIDAGRRKDVKVRMWVATILQQISSSASPEVSSHARTLLDNLQQEQALDIPECRVLYTLLPIPTVFPLLERALNITDIDHELACIRFRSLEECLYPASIPLRAKAKLSAPKGESFPLMEKVQEFLQSDNLVFLLLGDSGSGKSIFCKQLERELWSQYQHSDDGRIPLYINLPSIDNPHCGLIEKYLQHHHNILESVIQKIKHHRQLVLICDGYDEARLIQNLHTSNRLNRLGQWNVKMIITCRSTFISRDYQDNFSPLGHDKYHDKSSRLFEEATIVPFSKSDIQEYVRQYVLDFAAQEPSDNPPALSFDDYWKKLSIIPNLMNLVSNPFLLTLALKAIPSRSIEALDSTGLQAMQHDLYDGFIQEWVRLHQKRLQGTVLKQDIRAAFDILLRDGFAWCVTDYLKRLADAIYQYQDGSPVVKFSRWHMEEWKVKFFGPEIETTLLREASPLTRAGTRHWFIHKSLLDYFYARTFFDPDDSDDDDFDGGEDGYDDSRGGGDDFHGGGGKSLGDGGDSFSDDNGDSAGGYGGSTGGNAESTDSNGRSSGSNGGSTSGNQDSSSGGNSSGDSSGGSSDGNNEGSRGDKNDPDGNEDGSCRRNDDARSKRKGNATKSRPFTSSDPFSKRNLIKEPSVLQFLVERAKSDSRLKKRLSSVIEQSKASSVPSLAAANAITILFKSGSRFQDAVLDGVLIPSNYISKATGNTEPVQLPEGILTGGDLLKVLMTSIIPVSVPTVPTTALAVPVSASTFPAPMPFSTTIAQKTPTASLKPSSQTDSPNPDQAIPHASDDELSQLFKRIPGFGVSSNKDHNHILGSAHQLNIQPISMKTKSTLTTLSLNDNSIGLDGTRELSEALKTNSTLTTLSLNDNSIGLDGTRALSEALKTNSTLTTLSLNDNSIGLDGTREL
ncbi:Transducin (beta)-like 1 X-linked receptor 1, partial [Mortierella sp. 14UC]